MSLYTFSSRLLTIRPRMRFTEDLIRIEDGFFTKLGKLGIGVLRTEFHLNRKVMEHRARTWWFRPRETLIPFSQLSHIDYDYESSGTSWSGFWNQFRRHDQIDTFKVAIAGKSGKVYPICSFHGEGSVETGWMGVLLYDDSAIDLAGTQEGESRQFVNALAQTLDISVGLAITEIAEMATCASCGHPTSLHSKKCLYCGTARADDDPPSS